MPWVFCSREDITAFHPIPITELRDEWSTLVEGLIRDHLGQSYLGLDEPIADEWHNGDGSPFLRPKHAPILSVDSLAINGSSLQPSDYVVFDQYIQLRSQVFPRGNLNVRLSYSVGSTSIDPVVRLAAVSMIIAVINYRKRAGSDSSLKWSGIDQRVGEESPATSEGLMKHLRDIMLSILKRPKLRVY